MKLRTHLLLTYCALTIIPLVLFALLLNSNARVQRIKEVEKQLTTLSEIADSTISNIVADLKSSLALAPETIDAAEYITSMGNKSPVVWATEHADAVQAMDKAVASWKTTDDSILDGYLVNTQGVIVYANSPELRLKYLGNHYAVLHPPDSYDGSEITFGSMSYERSGDILSQNIFVPVRAGDILLGTLVVHINDNHLTAFVLSNRVENSSRELVLVARDGDTIIFLTPLLNGSRIGVERSKIGDEKAIPAQRALQGTTGTVIGVDYRGVPVFSATKLNAALGIGIVSKMNIEELEAPLRSTLYAGLGLGAIALPLLLILSFIYTSQITEPMRHLMWYTGRLALGDFTAVHKEVSNRSVEELQLLHTAVSDMGQKVSELDRNKTELISIAAHQLRAPLSSLNWYAELLASDHVEALTEIQHTAIREISASSRNLSDLVSAMLEVSRAEMGTLSNHPQSTLIAPLVRQFISELEATIKVRGVAIEASVPEELVLCIDPKLFGLIVTNLLSNGIKYTPDGGHVSLQIQLTADKACEIIVTDTGIGIPEDEQPKIFQKMFRAANATKLSEDGTGLGLYLVKKVVGFLGGTIHFTSKVNAGTTFTVQIPKPDDCRNV